jgi:hypothetical protein
MVFNLVQLYVLSWVLKTKSFFPSFSLFNQFPFWPDYWVIEYFWGFLDILGYINISIMQDGVWFIYFLGINGFPFNMNFDLFLLCSLYINLKGGSIEQILVFTYFASFIARPVR